MRNWILFLLISTFIFGCGKPDLEAYRQTKIDKFKQRHNATRAECDTKVGFEREGCLKLFKAREELGVSVIKSLTREDLQRDWEKGLDLD